MQEPLRFNTNFGPKLRIFFFEIVPPEIIKIKIFPFLPSPEKNPATPLPKTDQDCSVFISWILKNIPMLATKI